MGHCTLCDFVTLGFQLKPDSLVLRNTFIDLCTLSKRKFSGGHEIPSLAVPVQVIKNLVFHLKCYNSALGALTPHLQAQPSPKWL